MFILQLTEKCPNNKIFLGNYKVNFIFIIIDSFPTALTWIDHFYLNNQCNINIAENVLYVHSSIAGRLPTHNNSKRKAKIHSILMVTISRNSMKYVYVMDQVINWALSIILSHYEKCPIWENSANNLVHCNNYLLFQ